MLSQLVSSPSSMTEVRRPSSFLRVSRRIRLSIIKLDEFHSYIKGRPDRWCGHAPPKLKLDKNNSSCFVGESEHMCVCVPCLCFSEGLYRTNDIVIVVLTRHSDLLL